MSVLAAIRPNEWELPLFIHVLGALALIGTVTLSAALLFSAWRGASVASLRLALRSLTLGVIPSWVVLRGSAEWIADKEGYFNIDDPPDWVDLGYMAGDIGFLLIVVSSVLVWITYRKVRAEPNEGPSRAVRAAAVLIALLLVLNLVALWAMTTKPT